MCGVNVVQIMQNTLDAFSKIIHVQKEKLNKEKELKKKHTQKLPNQLFTSFPNIPKL